MITVKDCEAFCDANPNRVHELACRESLGMVQAYARAHESMGGADDGAMPAPAHQAQAGQTVRTMFSEQHCG